MCNKEESFVGDEIGAWSQLKLTIVKKYLKPYSQILSNKGFEHFYIDAFSGAGLHKSKKTRKIIFGSPYNAVNTNPPFKHYYFIDKNLKKLEFLRRYLSINGFKKNITYYNEDSNHIITNELVPYINKSRKRRALCFLDPYGLHLNWNTVEAVGNSNKTDIFINFPWADIQRNILHKRFNTVLDLHKDRMTLFWGDNSWKEIAFEETTDLFNKTSYTKVANAKQLLTQAYKERLMKTANFKEVLDPLPIYMSNNVILFYLYFASQQKVATKIASDIFKNEFQPKLF